MATNLDQVNDNIVDVETSVDKSREALINLHDKVVPLLERICTSLDSMYSLLKNQDRRRP